MIAIVSGIPRSGTSLMMQMLSAGGMPLLTDESRVPDRNNPRGYCEWTPIKSLFRSPETIAAAEGQAVKVISSLLPALSNQHQYRVIFMCRSLEEIVASQNKMLDRLGKEVPSTPIESVAATFRSHLEHIRTWLAQQPNMFVLYLEYAGVLKQPQETARIVSVFLGRALDIEAMSRQVEQSLHHEKVDLSLQAT
jgi:hypothetical protein